MDIHIAVQPCIVLSRHSAGRETALDAVMPLSGQHFQFFINSRPESRFNFEVVTLLVSKESMKQEFP